MHKTIPLVTALLLGAVSPTFGMIAKDENTIVIGDGDVTTKILPLRVVSLTDRLIQVPGGKEQVNLVLENCLKNDFSGITPVLIQSGELEVLIDDSKILAENLKTSGAEVQLEIWKDMFHVWHYFAKYLSEGRQAIKQISNFIKKYS